jgi:hypothetical protein
MTKQDLIELTLKTMHNSRYSNPTEEPGGQDADEYDEVVLTALTERLPEGDIKTCEDLSLGVECCETCHTFYPHYEMYFETLPGGGSAWICCGVRRALQNPGKSEEDQETEWVDLEEALGGGLRQKKRSKKSAQARSKE